MATFFSDYFALSDDDVEGYGAFNVSLINDLPLFVDPFLLFNNENDEYRTLHDAIINYLVFLRDKADSGVIDEGLLRLWYCFPEVKQNWLGFSVSGNSGSGLGMKFARALHKNLHLIFSDFGQEKITKGSHLEKVCLISSGVGRDNISDFTTNLIKDYLCRYTERFAKDHLRPEHVREVSVEKATFRYDTESWIPGRYTLPWVDGDYIILTPKDMLTRDDNWINRDDLITNFEAIPEAIPDAQLRAQVANYFSKILVKTEDREPTKKERGEAATETIQHFPQLLDWYIKLKENKGDEATKLSAAKVLETRVVFVEHLKNLQNALLEQTEFYNLRGTTYEEAHARLAYLKDVIENKGGHRIFYHEGKPVEREKDLQILYRLVWFGTPSDVGAEANDGRGPVDYKISRGAFDKTLVEIKLAKNKSLERNLQRQVPIYQAASDAERAIKAIIFYSEAEEERVVGILDRLGVLGHRDIVLIDARADNKPSGSKA